MPIRGPGSGDPRSDPYAQPPEGNWSESPPPPPKPPLWDRIPDWVLGTIGATLAVALIIGVFVGILFGAKSFSRYQKRQDAKNNVTVTATQIKVAEQQAQVNRAQIEATKAEAEKKYQESIGIRRAQDEIQKTLTPIYVQHEAVQAQLAMAHSENHTLIWAPSGANVTPLVFPQNP